MIDRADKIFIAGHQGLVGSALVRKLEADGWPNLLKRDRRQLDLTRDRAVTDFFSREKPDIVILAAAKVGGIKANHDFPVEFMLDNLLIQSNVIRAAYENG